MGELTLEVNSDFIRGNDAFNISNTLVVITPLLNADYWAVTSDPRELRGSFL